MPLRTALRPGAVMVAGLLALPSSYDAAPRQVPAGDYMAGIEACAVAPESVRLRPTQNAPGSRGSMLLTAPPSPFGITVDAEGHQTQVVVVQVDRLRRRSGATYVVWATTPELDQVTRLGILGDENRVSGPIAWNKFLVFISEEASPDVEHWAGPILLTGLSPSGRMHTMAGHGPFEGVSCSTFY